MQERIYLLSLEEALPRKEEGQMASPLKAGEPLLDRMLQKIDAERYQKALSKKNRRARAESAGAGLLLQLAVQEADAGKISNGAPVSLLSVSRLLDRTTQKLELQYTYGAWGKPYLKNYPYFFSLSHSGEYVLCVISRTEVGADIQRTGKCVPEKMAGRFFAEAETEKLLQCRAFAEKESVFYELWTCKEAYGKLTGQGISKSLEMDMSGCLNQEISYFQDRDGRSVRMQRLAPCRDFKAAVCSYL